MSKINIFLIISVFFTSFFINCQDKKEIGVPNVYVNFYVDTDLPQYFPLKNIGGIVFIDNEGYNKNGIILFCSGIDEYKAYDRTCTYKIADNCKLDKDKSSITNVFCPCCNSKFELFSGSKVSGNAIYPLKEYNVTVVGSRLNITN